LIYRLPRVIVSTVPPVDDNTWKYYVEITESDGSGSKTVHNVTVDRDYYEMMSNQIVLPEEFVKRSINFLLKKEDKDSILKEFNIRQISNYFPEYEDEIRKDIIE
jgi:hypothetical protein